MFKCIGARWGKVCWTVATLLVVSIELVVEGRNAGSGRMVRAVWTVVDRWRRQESMGFIDGTSSLRFMKRKSFSKTMSLCAYGLRLGR